MRPRTITSGGAYDIREAIELFRDHQKNSARDKTRESYGHLLRNLEALLGDTTLNGVSSQDLYQFLLLLTEGLARSTGDAQKALRPPRRQQKEGYIGVHENCQN